MCGEPRSATIPALRFPYRKRTLAAPPLRSWKRAGTSANCYHKLSRPTQRQNYGSGYSVTYSYDSLCRETARNFGPTEINNAAGSSGSTFQSSYDPTTGRMNTITYPSGIVASFGYSPRNYPSESLVASAGGSAQLFSKILTANAALQPMTGTTGDGVGTVWSWDGNNRLSDITAGPSGSATSVQNLGYLYDGLGNVTYRRDSIAGFAESFTYDAKNQLTAAYLNSDTAGKAFAYDALGNLTYRSDIGIFTYGYSGKPHTLASIQVDPNSPYAATAGTLESNNYSWTWFNKVSEVTQSGGDTLQYEYDNRHRRYTQTDVSTTVVTTYLYGPGGTEEDQSGRPHIGGVALHDLIPGPGGIVGEVLAGGTGTITSTYYYHKDQLGSVTAVSGSSSEVDSYDVWGKRRLTNGGDDTNCSTTSIASRGYIAEEHIQGDCPVINLNARLYDPLTTRFLSPDPMGLAAGPNPYAYAGNNPITSSDSTGLDQDSQDGIETVTVTGERYPDDASQGSDPEEGSYKLWDPRSGITFMFGGLPANGRNPVPGGSGAKALTPSSTVASQLKSPSGTPAPITAADIDAAQIVGSVPATDPTTVLTSGVSIFGTTLVTSQSLGNDAHEVLLQRALQEGPAWFGNRGTAPDGTRFRSGPYGLFTGRPDLGNAAIKQLWELKPAGSEMEALDQVWDYSIHTAPLFGPPVYRPAKNAPAFFMGNSLMLPGAFGEISYQFWGSGVLSYTYNTNGSVVTVPNFFALPAPAPEGALGLLEAIP